jgi:uncharacterized membrane protein
VLMLADLAVLIYFLNHIAVQIQLPQVIASIAGDLQQAIELQVGNERAAEDAELASAVLAGMHGPGAVVGAPRSGYLQYVEHEKLVSVAAQVDAVVHVLYRPGHFLVQGHPYVRVWPATAVDEVAHELAGAHVTGPYRTLAQDVSFGMDQLVEICIRALSSAINDTFTALTCIDWIGDSLYKVTGRWQPTRVYRDGAGTVRVIATETTYARLVSRGFEKVRQAGRGMPAVLIRQLDALTRIMERTISDAERQVLLDQAGMIERLGESTVDEPADREDIKRAHQAVLTAHASVLAVTPG